MAVADAALKPSPLPTPPPPARVVDTFLRIVLAPRVVPVAARALPCLGFAVVWVLSAASAARIVAARAWGEGSAPCVFLEALTDAAAKASICIILLCIALVLVLICALFLAYVSALLSGSVSNFKKRAFGATTRELALEWLKFPRAVILGAVADLAFLLLGAAGVLIMTMSSHVEFGSWLEDVGLFGFHAICCFVIIPSFVLRIWSLHSDRKAGLTVAVC